MYWSPSYFMKKVIRFYGSVMNVISNNKFRNEFNVNFQGDKLILAY